MTRFEYGQLEIFLTVIQYIARLKLGKDGYTATAISCYKSQIR